MSAPRSVLFAAFGLLALGGCSVVNDPSQFMGGTPDAGPPDAGRRVELDEICPEFARITCYGAAHCCDRFSEDDEVFRAACEGQLESQCDGSAFALLADDPRLRYDAYAAAQAFEELEAIVEDCRIDIAGFLVGPNGLRSLFDGTLGRGETCPVPSEEDPASLLTCRGQDVVCVPSADLTTAVCGSLVEDGRACFFDIECLSGLCNGVCAQPGPGGTPCTRETQCISFVCTDGFCVDPEPMQIYCGT